MGDTSSQDALVTVGLPVYNAERFLGKSIETLLAQTFSDFVILISDNASTDKTAEICQDYASRDPRIRYHRNETNIGMPGNYNLTFGMSHSKYFRWATGDDYCAPEHLQDHVQILESEPSIALCYSRAWFVDENDRQFEQWQDELHLMQDDPKTRFRRVVKGIMRVHHHLGLMRSDCMRRTGLIAGHVSSDIGFVAEMSLYGKFFQIEKRQFFRRLHEDSSSWATHDEEHQARRYHASQVRRIRFNHVRYHWRFVQAVHRSPLSLRDRLDLYAFLTRYALSKPQRRRLIDEFRYEFKLSLPLSARS